MIPQPGIKINATFAHRVDVIKPTGAALWLCLLVNRHRRE